MSALAVGPGGRVAATGGHDRTVILWDLAAGRALATLSGHTRPVVGVAFAIAPDRPGTSYALTSRELTTDLAVRRGGSVSTGPCLSNA